MMTREKLEHIRNSLMRYSDNYYMGEGVAYHECCDGKVEDTNGEISLRGHLYECHLMESIKMIDLELAKL